jgi:hypothetical protein
MSNNLGKLICILVFFSIAFRRSMTQHDGFLRKNDRLSVDIFGIMKKMPIMGNMSYLDKLRFIKFVKMKLENEEKLRQSQRQQQDQPSLFPADMINPADF